VENDVPVQGVSVESLVQADGLEQCESYGMVRYH